MAWGWVGMREKEPWRGVIRSWRPPQRLFIAISFHQKGNLWTGKRKMELSGKRKMGREMMRGGK